MAKDAFKLAYKLLGLRLRSVFEMEEKLKEKKIKEETISQVIEKLKEQKYLDDEKFAEAWILDRINLHPRGSFMISQELKEKGVASKIIERKLTELLPFEKELEITEELFAKKMKIIKANGVKLSKEKTYQKMANFLRAKGFSGEVIRETMENKLISHQP